MVLFLQNKDYFIHLETPCFPYAEGIEIKKEIHLAEILNSVGFEDIKVR